MLTPILSHLTHCFLSLESGDILENKPVSESQTTQSGSTKIGGNYATSHDKNKAFL